MGTPIETVSVSQYPDTITAEEVTCVFCGLPTPVPALGSSTIASHVPRHIWIIRCEVCGKEAPYRACDIFEFGDVQNVRSHAHPT